MKTLVVIAMKEESQGLFEAAGIPVLYTGIGKVNATYALTKKLYELKALGQTPDLVANFGTAGSFTFKTHSLIECSKFAQRDMDVSALGIAPGVTPFDKLPKILEFEKLLPDLQDGICASGDSFETTTPKVKCDVVDMEAYALAKICRLENLKFLSIKFITDGSDDNAHKDWVANLPHAAKAFLETYRRLNALPIE